MPPGRSGGKRIECDFIPVLSPLSLRELNAGKYELVCLRRFLRSPGRCQKNQKHYDCENLFHDWLVEKVSTSSNERTTDSTQRRCPVSMSRITICRMKWSIRWGSFCSNRNLCANLPGVGKCP